MVESYDKNGTAFPKITICSHSQHSQKKINQYYPNFPREVLTMLYGHALNESEYNHWIDIVQTKVY